MAVQIPDHRKFLCCKPKLIFRDACLLGSYCIWSNYAVQSSILVLSLGLGFVGLILHIVVLEVLLSFLNFIDDAVARGKVQCDITVVEHQHQLPISPESHYHSQNAGGVDSNQNDISSS